MSSIRQRLAYTQHCLFRVKTSGRGGSTESEPGSSNLARCLSTLDLTSLGIGSILGAGIYVVSGQVAMNIAGPSIILSFTIAAFASLLSGLCYAEFGSRVPRTTGSAYAYSYHTVGEFIAFIIGWNLILEYMIGTAADARALSSSVDYLLGRRLQNLSMTYIGNMPHLGSYPDFLAFFMTILVTLVLALGVKESARYASLFNILNGAIAIAVIVIGSFKANTANWGSTKLFFPKGAHGVFAGAAACFYAFVGFDIIATTGMEAKDASRSIPTAVALSLVVCYVLYVGVSSVLTLMTPFGSLHSASPLTEAFDTVGLHWAKWVIGLGAVFGLSASLLGSEFPLPRIIYAMAYDGLLFKFFRQVSTRTETPILATVVPGVITAFFSMLFDLQELVEMMSIGTLLAYSLVCTSILLLRYRPNPKYTHLYEEETSSERNSNALCLNDVGNDVRESDSEDEVFLAPNANDNTDSKRPLLKPPSKSYTSLSSPPTSSHQHSRTPSILHLIPCREKLSKRPTVRSGRLVLKLTVAIWLLSIIFSVLLLIADKRTTVEDSDIPIVGHHRNSTNSTGIYNMSTSISPTLSTPVSTTANVTLHPEPYITPNQSDRVVQALLLSAALVGLTITLCTWVISRQPQDLLTLASLHFKVPLVPFTPILTIVINVFLMVRLSHLTWIRFAIWMIIGLLIYFLYGIRNSEESFSKTLLRTPGDGQSSRPPNLPDSDDTSSSKHSSSIQPTTPQISSANGVSSQHSSRPSQPSSAHQLLSPGSSTSSFDDYHQDSSPITFPPAVPNERQATAPKIRDVTLLNNATSSSNHLLDFDTISLNDPPGK